MSKKSTLKKALAIAAILVAAPFMAQLGLAQTVPPPPPPPPVIPITGGLALLVAAGAAYGANKLYKKNKEEE